MAKHLTTVLLLFCLYTSLTLVISSEIETTVEEECDGFTCIKKCCNETMFINISYCAIPANESSLWTPTFHDSSLTPITKPPGNLKYLYGIMECDSTPLLPVVNPDDIFYLQEDGMLYVPVYGKSYNTDMYCLDTISFSESETEVALLCFEDDASAVASKICLNLKTYLYPALLMVSCVFLLITLTVYICIPELHGKLHGRCLISMISSMLVAYIMMFVVYIESHNLSPKACVFCASVKHITLLASFFWLNVMCFDIWRTLKSMRPASETSARSRQRFGLYSLYAWGSPLVIGIVAVVIDSLPDSHTRITRPNFVNPRNFCWFDGDKSIWVYFYMIVLILVVTNIIFFALVAYIILKSQNNQRLQTARSQNRDRIWLYGKLFLVMGITWITEVISWKEGTCEAWIFTDIINALQGFIIFLIFVCKRTTRQMVFKKVSKISGFKVSGAAISSSTGKRSSTFFTSLNTSSTAQTESSVYFNSSEQRRSIDRPGTPNIISSSNNYHMASITETKELIHNENVTAGNQRSLPGEVEDCPSICRHSDIEEVTQSLSGSLGDDHGLSDEATSDAGSTLPANSHQFEVDNKVRESASSPEEFLPLMGSGNQGRVLPPEEIETR